MLSFVSLELIKVKKKKKRIKNVKMKSLYKYNINIYELQDLESLHSRYNVEALFWSFSLGIFILRFMTLGTKINKKYRNLSVLITEQVILIK